MHSTMALANLTNQPTVPQPRQSLRWVAALAMLLGPVLVMTGLPGAANAADLARPVAAETAPPPAEAARTLPVGSPASPSTSASEARTYEAREAQAKSLEQFKGGDTVVIAGSTVVLVLLVVLLIVLI